MAVVGERVLDRRPKAVSSLHFNWTLYSSAIATRKETNNIKEEMKFVLPFQKCYRQKRH
jgi:hypothetical protein